MKRERNRGIDRELSKRKLNGVREIERERENERGEEKRKKERNREMVRER